MKSRWWISASAPMVHRTTSTPISMTAGPAAPMLWTNYRNTSEPVDPPGPTYRSPGGTLWSFFTIALSFLKSHRGMFLTVQGAAEFYVLDEIITDALKRKLSESAPGRRV